MTTGFTIKDIKDGLQKGHFSAEEIFKKYIEKIEKENKNLNAYLNVFDTGLAGIPAAIKDNILIEGTICTAGSKILKNYVSAYDTVLLPAVFTAMTSPVGEIATSIGSAPTTNGSTAIEGCPGCITVSAVSIALPQRPS